MTTIRIGYSTGPEQAPALQTNLLRRAGSDETLVAVPVDVSAGGDIDAILIDGQRDDSAAAVIEALGRGWHVLVSGLPGRSVEDIIEIRRAEAMARPRKLKIDLGFREHSSVRSARAIMATGELGELVSIRSILGIGTGQQGVLLHHGAAMLDLIHQFAGPLEQVQSLVDATPDAPISSDRNVMALMRNHAGTLISLHVSSTQWRETFRIEAGFSHGYVWLDGLLSTSAGFGPEMLIIGRTKLDAQGQPIPNPDEQITEFQEDQAADHVLCDFLDAIRSERAIQSGNSLQAFDAMNTLHRIYAADPQLQFV